MHSTNYRPDIQGLRAIAVLMVMLFHFNTAMLPGGFIGVDVFLVISGYLITSILQDKKDQPGYRPSSALRYFYVSRIKRIAPAYFSMLVLVSLMVAVLFLPQHLGVYKNSLGQAARFNSNNYFAGFGDYFAPANHQQPLLHTWSLAVEIQFYLLAPFLVLLVPARALKWLLLVLLVGLTALAEYRLRVQGIRQDIYYSLFPRLPEFFAGALVALSMRSGKTVESKAWLNSLGLGLLLFAAALQPRLGAFPGFAALLPVAGTVLMLMSPARGAAGQLLASKPMVWLGQLSYSLYLWHWPVLALLRYYTGAQLLDMPSSLMFGTVTLLLAILSYYWVETPFRYYRTSIKQILGYGLLTGATLAIGPSMAKINQAFSPAQLPIEYQRYADPATICHGQIVGDCLKGDLSSNNEVLVLGDSHAAMLNLFFDKLGKELGFKARIITASSCVTIPGFDYNRIDEWARQPCLKQIQDAERHIQNAKTIFLVGMWSWQMQSERFRSAFAEFLKNDAPQAKKYVLSQVPIFNKNPLLVRREESLGVGAVVGREMSSKIANDWIKKVVASSPGVFYLELDNIMLFKQAPWFEGVLFYSDDIHINEYGALIYAEQAKVFFESIVKNNNNLMVGN